MAKKPSKHASKQVQSLTTGTTIRFEQPKSKRKPRPNVAVVMAQEMNPVEGFIDFLKHYAVVGLAIGFVIGTQAQVLVKQLVSSFIDPLFKLLFGEALNQRTFTWHFHDRSADFGWGAFLYILLNFFFVLAMIYIIVKFFKLDKLDKSKTDK